MSLIEIDRQRSAGRERLAPRAIATQAVVITAAFLSYLAVRWLANGSEEAALRHARRLLDVEAHLGIDVEQRAQHAVLDLPGVIGFFNFVYAWTYWPYIIATFVVAWFWRRSVFTLYRNAMLISGAVGLVLFTLLPVAPPRFLDGFTDTVGQSGGSAFVGQPDGLINEFAALPSFHVGWVALASAAMFFGTDRRWLRAALVVPVALM
ncbi:MAG: phosphatase PAP2 family protein [Ilumatobacter sp.]|uniref:phosphatase PAP2 family protein n=1 Tax=Ilumatobacter sp. TaxID=1967498 RepID=UPI003C718D90